MKWKCIFSIILFLTSLNFELNAQTASLEPTLNLKEVDGVTIPIQNGFPLPSFEKQNRETIELAGKWKKQRFSSNDNITLAKRDSAGYSNLISESQGMYLSSYNDSAWADKQIPGVENEMHDYPNVPEYYEDGVWYRRTFTLPDSLAGKFAKLIFLSVNYVADVWINDKYIGYHEGGYTPFSFDVSSYLNYGSSNTIAVRVDNIAWSKRKDIIPYTIVDWFNYTGIIHDVYLEFSNSVSVLRADIVPLDLNGNLQTTVVLNNKKDTDENTGVSIKIYEASIDSNNINTDFSYQLAGAESAVSGNSQVYIIIPSDSFKVWSSNIEVMNPKLWSPKNPDLYIMKITIKKGDIVLDEFSTQFGIRTVSTLGNKLLLNNRISFLTGAARHEDHPVYGRNVPEDIIFNDLKIIKNLNVNFLRTAHYPNHPYTYLIADRLGITVMEEIPVYWFDDENAWVIQNSSRHMHLQMFREMVFKDYNRPSVILWGTSNECHEVTNRLIYNQMIKNDITVNYNDHRLITQSSAGDNPGPQDTTQAPLDAAGWTLYFGIFHGSTYYGGTLNFLLQAKTAFPDKPILDTEFGYWSSENNSTETEQVTVFNETFKAFKFFSAVDVTNKLNPNGILMACTWWTAFDWYTASQPRGFQSMGLYSMDRTTAKPVASALRNAYLPYYNLDGVLTGYNENSFNGALPANYELEQNYPNPFNPVTQIGYSIEKPGAVSLNVYDVLGRKVAELVNESQKAGRHLIDFNASSISSGVYFYELKAGNFQNVKKMILIK